MLQDVEFDEQLKRRKQEIPKEARWEKARK